MGAVGWLFLRLQAPQCQCPHILSGVHVTLVAWEPVFLEHRRQAILGRDMLGMLEERALGQAVPSKVQC